MNDVNHKDEPATRKVFRYFLMGLGGLIMLVSGSCSMFWLTQGRDGMGIRSLGLLIGGVSFVIGLAFYAGGSKLRPPDGQ